MPDFSLDDIARSADAVGLELRGAFNPAPEDGVPAQLDGCATGTLVLLGWIGSTRWPAFANSPEAQDGLPDPLDRWSSRVVGGLASLFNAVAIFPFGSPPRINFQHCGRKAEPVHPSPVGVLIHPDHGPWHCYRGALALADRLDCHPVEARPSPCDSCTDRPCLSACPVGAFSPGRYDLAACSTHLNGPGGDDCVTFNCAARGACPVGAEFRYSAEQSTFHMRNFRTSVKRHVQAGLSETDTSWAAKGG